MASATQVQAAVDRLGASLGHPVLVEDPQHRPLWWSAQGTVDGTRMRTILQRDVDPAATAVVARLGLARASGPVRVPASPEAEMLARWCIPLRSGRDLLGYLWVLDPDEAVTADQLADAVACAEMATDVISQERLAGGGRDKRRAVLLRELAVAEDPDAARELIHLEELDPGVRVSVNAPRRAGGWELPDGMSVHTADARSSGATSGPPLPLVRLHLAVERARQVQRALRSGARLADPTWDSLGAWHLIATAPAELAVADIHPGADVLSALERDDLLVTARSVLEAGGDVAQVAEALHLHRTTLYYRLARIEAMTGVNLKAGPDRDSLLFALRLAAYRGAP
jgi:PucR-like helix-turn-helix protein